MESSDDKIQQLHGVLQEISFRLSRIEESLASPHECFSKSYFNEIMRTLSVPGLRFIGGKLQHGIHSYVWIVIHVVALLISYVYIREEYDNWQASPVLRTLSNNLTFVGDIPFPAVTICVPFSFNSDYDLLESVQKCVMCNSTPDESNCFYKSECDQEELDKLSVAHFLCQFQGVGNVSQLPKTILSQDFNTSVDGDVYAKYIREILPPCDFLIKVQKLRSEEILVGCDKNGFQHFLADGAFGMCTTVNGLRHEDIYKENLFHPVPLSPNRVDPMYNGGSFTLESMLYYNGSPNTIPIYYTDNDFVIHSISKRQNQTYKNECNFYAKSEVASVFLHNPGEVPLYQDLGYIIKTNEFNYMKVVPKLVTTKEDLARYSPSQRGCYYSFERELMLFKYYTASHCEAECFLNCSLEICGCVPHFMPRPNTSTRVCLDDCQANYCHCGCLPDCVSLSYEFEGKAEAKDTDGSGIVMIYHKSRGFYPMIRVGINSLSDFMAYSFGILGTFNGFSVMVIFEFIYFITIRLWSSIKNYLNKSIKYDF